MNTTKSLACLLGVLSLPIETASAQNRLDLFFQDNKRFQIVGPSQSEYLGGDWTVQVLDGIFLLLPCYDGRFFPEDPTAGLQYITPNIACPNGTTALITQGDFDGDGLQDIGRYFSVDQPIPARSIEPFTPDEIELFAAPPSQLPRPIDAFEWVDQSVVGFYDIVSDPINGVGYEVAFYRSTRPYLPTELRRHRDEIVPGVYLFKFAGLGHTPQDPRDFFMSVAHREMVEAAPGPGGQTAESGGISVGNDFRLFDEERWNNQEMELDPRLGFDFSWEGFNPSTFYGNDELRFSVRDRDTGFILFPPIPDPENNPETRQLIGGSTLGIPSGIDIGANFFAPDNLIVAELEFSRFTVSGASIDASTRIFRWNISLIDSYEGFRRANFPLGTPVSLRSPSFDYDGDGYTNLEEFGLQTDPVNPADVPSPTPLIDDFTDQCYLDVPKRPAVGSSLTYQIQYSPDLVNWTTIQRGDPNWFIVFDNEDELSVLSRRPSGVNPCFLRVRLRQN